MNATLIEKTFMIYTLETCKAFDNSLHTHANNLINNIIESDKIEYRKELEKLFKVS